jgi:hypothetical protein
MERMTQQPPTRSAAASDHASTVPADESDEITKVLSDYLLAWYSGSPERMASALHPALIKRRIDHEREYGPTYLRTLRYDEMIAATEAGIGLDPKIGLADIDVRVLWISGEIASAAVQSPDWTDLVHLVKDDRVWRVLNVLYRRRTHVDAAAPQG